MARAQNQSDNSNNSNTSNSQSANQQSTSGQQPFGGTYNPPQNWQGQDQNYQSGQSQWPQNQGTWNNQPQGQQGWNRDQTWNQNQRNQAYQNQGYQNQSYGQPQWSQNNNRNFQGNTAYSAGSQDPRFQQSGNQSNNGQNEQQNQQGGPSLGVTLTAHPTHGVVVAYVDQNAPAAQAGLQHGDQIVAVNGQHVYSNQDLIRVIHRTSPQSGPLNLLVERNGQTMHLQAMLFPNHDQGWMSNTGERLGQGPMRERPALGVTLHQNGQDDVRISNVFPGSAAQHAGLQPGDRIVSIGNQRIAQTNDVLNQLAQVHPDERLPIQIERNGQYGTVYATPEEQDQMFQHQQGSQNQQGVNR
ncbi:MAG TPA: PDZ domain-containing protein [Pirellulales bacterium]|nr:PDZ domain-containing protein [Pirellulales bacterium]